MRRSRRGSVQFVLTIPAGLHAQAPARRAPFDRARGGRFGPDRHERRARRVRRSSSSVVARKDLTGPFAALAGTPAAFQGGRAPALQSRVDHAIQHRSGADGGDPHDDARDDDGPCHHARARARHDGESARHAHHAARGDDGQDHSLHRDRPHPGEHHPAGRAVHLRRSIRRQRDGAVCRFARSSSRAT